VFLVVIVIVVVVINGLCLVLFFARPKKRTETRSEQVGPERGNRSVRAGRETTIHPLQKCKEKKGRPCHLPACPVLGCVPMGMLKALRNEHL
jgi:hypothetical protein